MSRRRNRIWLQFISCVSPGVRCGQKMSSDNLSPVAFRIRFILRTGWVAVAVSSMHPIRLICKIIECRQFPSTETILIMKKPSSRTSVLDGIRLFLFFPENKRIVQGALHSLPPFALPTYVLEYYCFDSLPGTRKGRRNHGKPNRIRPILSPSASSPSLPEGVVARPRHCSGRTLPVLYLPGWCLPIQA
jgi:hypothetical protein